MNVGEMKFYLPEFFARPSKEYEERSLSSREFVWFKSCVSRGTRIEDAAD